jgi:DNA primase
MQRFELGLAPQGWDFLLTRLSGRGYDADLLAQAGLVSRSDDGRRVYDRFRNRVTFPIRDSAGRIVSFGGRALDDSPAKYLNGPETEIFDKRRTLFRMFEASREIRDSGQAIIVEGYFDALSLAAAGVPGVVAVCGTALGPEHARLLRRWCQRVALFLDGDRAGREAARRSLSVLLEKGLGVRVALAGEGLDPDDLARAEGAEGVRAALANALEFPDFLAHEARALYDLASVDGRVAASQWALEHIVLLPSALARAEAADRVADALEIRDEVMRAELSRAARAQRRRLSRRASEGERGAASGPAVSPAEACLVRFAVAAMTGQAGSPDEASQVLDTVPRHALSPWTQTVLGAFEGRLREGAHVGLDRVCEQLSEGESRQLLELAFGQDTAPSHDDAQAAVAALRVGVLQERLKEIQHSIHETEDENEQERLLRDKLATAREIRDLESGAASEASRSLTGGE